MFKKLPLLLLCIIGSVQAQEFRFSGDVNLQGIYFSEEESPFWIHSNKRGRIDETTHLAGWTNFSGSYFLSENAFFEVGAGLLYQDGFSDKLQLDEIYLTFQNSWLIATVGRKQREELFRGLSATNENMLWSLNARPMPGVLLSTSRPIVFWADAGLAFEAAWEEYLMDDDRYVKNTHVHHKSFHLIFSKLRNIEITVGIQHFVQWGGTSPEFGDLPDGLDDYLKIITGQGLGSTAEDGVSQHEINGLGNHLGSYEVNLKTFYHDYEIQLLWNHIFEDGSGSVFRNTPDGRYGLYISDSEENKFINGFMYEFYYTKDQSSGSFITSDGTDNYFQNQLYASNWTYENRILGVPFVLLNDERTGIENNRFIVHHLGLTGIAFKDFPYKILASYRKNYGGKSNVYPETVNILSTYLDVLVWQSFLDVNVQLGSDFSSEDASNFGVGIRVHKDLF